MDLSNINEARSLALQRRAVLDRIRAVDRGCEIQLFLGNPSNGLVLKSRTTNDYQARISQMESRSAVALRALARAECYRLLREIDNRLRELGVAA